MEIVKQNETYKITDTVDSWVMEGTASKDVSGAININFSVTVSGELSEYLGDCGYFKPDDVLHRAASRIEDYENSGFTFTNQEEHKSIIVINRPDSAEEFIDTYNHEKNHVEMHICKEFGIDPYSEKAAYLSGQLAKKLFKAQLRNWIR